MRPSKPPKILEAPRGLKRHGAVTFPPAVSCLDSRAAQLDRAADALLMLGLVTRAERLAFQAAAMRGAA